MIDFEEDFEFEFESGIRSIRIKDCRIDSHRTMTHDPNRNKDVERQARIAAHKIRVKGEMQALGIRVQNELGLLDRRSKI